MVSAFTVLLNKMLLGAGLPILASDLASSSAFRRLSGWMPLA